MNTMTANKVWDIRQPKDAWERGYALQEYLRIGLKLVGVKRIPVNSDVFICDYCRKEYVGTNPFTCSERCDYLLSEAVDEARGK